MNISSLIKGIASIAFLALTGGKAVQETESTAISINGERGLLKIPSSDPNNNNEGRVAFTKIEPIFEQLLEHTDSVPVNRDGKLVLIDN